MNHLSRATVLLSNSGVVSSGDLGLSNTQALIRGCNTDPQEALDNTSNQDMVINIDKKASMARKSEHSMPGAHLAHFGLGYMTVHSRSSSLSRCSIHETHCNIPSNIFLYA